MRGPPEGGSGVPPEIFSPFNAVLKHFLHTCGVQQPDTFGGKKRGKVASFFAAKTGGLCG